MSYPEIIRWGIIGCGDVTEVKSGPAYQKTEGFEVTAVMRRNEEKVQDYARRHGIETWYTQADDLILDTNVDAVYIATPPDSHTAYALKVAEAGKICCIEKPMANSYEECLAVTEAFRNKGIPLFVAYYRRSLPRFKQVLTWLEENRIGEVRHINWIFTKPPGAADLSGAYNWRTDPGKAPGGYFDDLASHGLDLFTYLLGNIKDASGFHTNQQQRYAVSDAFTASWVHEQGTTGSGIWNFGCSTAEDRVELFGSEGTITFSVFRDNPVTLTSKTETERRIIDHPVHIQLHHVQDMAKQLLEPGFTHPSTGSTATHTSWVMDRILGKQ
ncbi:MAG: Gfo/Idh/MocA family oxidoreductase [Bacteroidota bacterium]